MLLPVALTTTGAAAIINVWLGARVSLLRRADNVMMGDGGNPRILARMRAQANFAEYTPIVLILIALIEIESITTPLWLWVVSAAYLLGRLLHARGMDGWIAGRIIGIASTMVVTVGLAGYALFLAYQSGNPLR
jgi:uncharacterized protein